MPNRPCPAGKASNLRAGRVSVDWDCYSITKVVQGRRRLLTDPAAAETILESWRFLRDANRIKLYAFCIMPDHVHFTCCLMPGEQLSGVVASFSKHTALRLNRSANRQGPFWQNGFHDRHCRIPRELEDLSQYIEHNPVRAGLAATAQNWAYTSANPVLRGMLDREWWP